MSKIQTRIQLEKRHLDWLKKLELRGVDKGSVVALALDLLIPKLKNIATSDEVIISTLVKKTVEEKLLY